jgi:hypothetical protein
MREDIDEDVRGEFESESESDDDKERCRFSRSTSPMSEDSE